MPILPLADVGGAGLASGQISAVDKHQSLGIEYPNHGAEAPTHLDQVWLRPHPVHLACARPTEDNGRATVLEDVWRIIQEYRFHNQK